jgi:hypothetical protein
MAGISVSYPRPLACLVCGVVSESRDDVTSADTRLTCSGSSAGEFLCGFNVVPTTNNGTGGAASGANNFRDECLCKACFDVVVNCDQWNYMLLSSLEGLKDKAARHSGRVAGEAELLLPKIEIDTPVS